MTIVRRIAKALALILIVLGLTATIVPHYLDRLYYEGPESGHYDGARFFHPDGDADTRADADARRARRFPVAATDRR